MAKRAATKKTAAEPKPTVDDLINQGTPVNRLEVPDFYANAFSIAVSANDINIVLSRPHPVVVGSGAAAQTGIGGEAVASISMSVQGAKDLMVLLGNMLSGYEEKFGPVRTAYLDKLAEDAQK